MAPSQPFSFNLPSTPGQPFSFTSSTPTATPQSQPFSFAPSSSTQPPSQPSLLSFSSTPSASLNSSSSGASVSHPAAGEGIDVDGDYEDQGDDDDLDVCYLEPEAWKRSEKAKWKSSGRTLLATVSPVGGEVAAWVARRPTADPKRDEPYKPTNERLSLSDRAIYIATSNRFPKPVQTLYAETYTLFVSLQRIVAASLRLPDVGSGISRIAAEAWDSKGNLVVAGFLGPPGAETVVHMRRLVDMYLEELMKVRESEIEDDVRLKYETVYHVFNLAEILYLPQDGRGEGLLGEELLDWVNAVDTIQINTQGNEIMKTKEPWSHPLFWPFINRCLLRGFFLPASSFLRTLSSHPHQPISELGLLLSTHVSVLPRSSNTASYPLDHQFLTAHKLWVARFRAELAAFLGGRGRGKWLDRDGKGKAGEWTSWEDDFRAVVELMEGKADRVMEESADWREAMGAWGVLVDVGLRRDDLPAVAARVFDKVPVDSTVLEESIQSSLCSGEIVKALMGCHDLDVWLAAHLGDVFDKLALIPDDEERFDTSLRDYFILEYTEHLGESTSYAGLWRVIAEYLSAAGDEGRNRLKEHIVHVALNEPRSSSTTAINGSTDGSAMDEDRVDAGGDGQGETGAEKNKDNVEDEFRHFTELRETCAELRLEEEWKLISTVMADRLIRQGRYGLAASMCLSAQDGYTLSRIAEKVVDAYIDEGDEAFLRLVDTLPSTMLSEAPIALTELQLASASSDPLKATSSLTLGAPGSTATATMVLFASRLACLSELRDFLLFRSHDARDRAAGKLVNLLTSGIAPVSLWSVLLVESVGLLEDEEIRFSSNDTFELMRVAEDVLGNAGYAAEEYLGMLRRSLKRGEEARKKGEEGVDGYAQARAKMDEVRLALARNLARALVVGFDNPF